MSTSEYSSISTLADVERRHISLLSERLDLLYQMMKAERLAIAQWEEAQTFSILGVVELFSAEIQGYAEQLDFDQHSSLSAESIDRLRRLNVFRVDYFASWYFQSLEQYPQTKEYVEQLDHLRLLLLEFFDR